MTKKIVILGAGESGVGAAILAKSKAYDIFISDYSAINEIYKKELSENNISFEENKHSEKIILNADEVIKSPGIPDSSVIIQKIKQKNIPIISEIEFASRYTKAKMICITGSNGKTTTTLLTYQIFKNAGYNVGIAGNIGNSFAKQVAHNDFDFYVLELSSFQLDNMHNFKADTSVLLNITPDHLDRYDNDFLKYVNSKFKITQNQTKDDVFIYNSDDETIKNSINDIKTKKLPFSIKVELDEGAFLENENLIFKTKNDFIEMLATDLSLRGKHNIYNSMAAALTAMTHNIKNPIIRETLTSFKNVEHRLENVLKIRGINFVNDSKATNVNSVWYALEAIDEKIVLILGGIDKGNDYSIIRNLVKKKVKSIVALGIDNEKIKDYFGKIVPVIETKSMDKAVMEAYKEAHKNDTVLLSPACASFDLFKNYIDRGNKFKNAVKNL
ncbi:MAG: UDP-N-acetylmuramoyl-L-alanine--D-glutamate ligase [Bacteroidota bacterium]|nr:UDP-N-acetylmuramoyl-L-alanine--D-glutamate ligase [Bacteroidota bacterium]